MFAEALGPVGQQPHALEEIVDDERLEHVQLEISRGTADIDRDVVAEHLRAQHRHRLGLRGIDLARHDRAAGLVFRNRDLADAAARAAREPAHVVCDLGERRGDRLQRAVGVHQGVVRRERLEFVARRNEGQPGRFSQLLGDARAEFGMSVEPRAHRGAAQGELAQVRERGANMGNAVVQLRHPAGDLLPERERSGVLQVRAADLDDVLERFGLRRQDVAQRRKRGYEPVVDRLNRGDAHRRGKNVVRGLTAVDLVVGMHAALLAALASQELARPVGEHLVHVHVGLGARARLPHHQRKFAVVLSGEHLVGGGGDGVRLLLGELLQLYVHARTRALDERERADQLQGHALAGNAEILERALRLRAPQPVGGNADLAEAVVLDAVIGHRQIPKCRAGASYTRIADFPDSWFISFLPGAYPVIIGATLRRDMYARTYSGRIALIFGRDDRHRTAGVQYRGYFDGLVIEREWRRHK